MRLAFCQQAGCDRGAPTYMGACNTRIARN